MLGFDDSWIHGGHQAHPIDEALLNLTLWVRDHG